MSTLYKTAGTASYKLLRGNAHQMRKEPTEAESVLWERLRRKNLGVRFYRQHIIDEYIVDFACLERFLIIEVDGKYHYTGEQQENDKKRENRLQQLGYTIIRFTNEAVMCDTDNTINEIKKIINNN